MLLMVLLVGAVLAGGYFFVQQSALGGRVTISTGGSSGCNIAPNINVLAADKLVSGTTPTVATKDAIYDGSYVGAVPSTVSAGKSLDVLATSTGYLNTESKIGTIGCGSNDLKFVFTPYAAPTIAAKDADSNTLATASLNETASANQIIDTVRLTGTPLKSTSNMLVVIEYANKTEVAASKITMKAGTRVNTPNWYTPSSTSASVAAFTVPEIYNGGVQNDAISFTPESGQTIGGATNGTKVTITAYTFEPVVLDSNTGKFLTSNTWQDSLGADKTIGSVSTSYFVA